jgi:hypothetical protein
VVPVQEQQPFVRIPNRGDSSSSSDDDDDDREEESVVLLEQENATNFDEESEPAIFESVMDWEILDLRREVTRFKSAFENTKSELRNAKSTIRAL